MLEWERIVQEMRIVTEQVVRGGLPQDKAVAELDQRVDKVLVSALETTDPDNTTKD